MKYVIVFLVGAGLGVWYAPSLPNLHSPPSVEDIYKNLPQPKKLEIPQKPPIWARSSPSTQPK